MLRDRVAPRSPWSSSAAVGVLLLAGGGVAAVNFTGGKSSPKAQQPLPAATQESPYARFEYAASTGCLDAALYSTAAGSAAACERKCGCCAAAPASCSTRRRARAGC
eukprot:jgi/Tetstr1/428563/TSEL_018557.t1